MSARTRKALDATVVALSLTIAVLASIGLFGWAFRIQ